MKPVQFKKSPQPTTTNTTKTNNYSNSSSSVNGTSTMGSYSTGWVKPPHTQTHTQTHPSMGKHETVGLKDETAAAALIDTKSLRMAFSSGQVKMVSRNRLWSSFSKPPKANLTQPPQLPPDTNDDSSSATTTTNNNNNNNNNNLVDTSISDSIKQVRHAFVSDNGTSTTSTTTGKVLLQESGVDLFSDDMLASFSNRKETINSETFFFSRPTLFFGGIKYLFLSMALYLALWLLQYVPASISVRYRSF